MAFATAAATPQDPGSATSLDFIGEDIGST
jgi:hypothetical protein